MCIVRTVIRLYLLYLTAPYQPSTANTSTFGPQLLSLMLPHPSPHSSCIDQHGDTQAIIIILQSLEAPGPKLASVKCTSFLASSRPFQAIPTPAEGGATAGAMVRERSAGAIRLTKKMSIMGQGRCSASD